MPIRPILLSACLAAAPLAAAACAWQPPLDLTAAPLAQAVFVGRLVGYDPQLMPGNPGVVTQAIATFDVVEVLSGSVPPRVSVLMLDRLTALPDRWLWDDTVIVAVLPAGSGADIAPDLPVLLHPTCGTPFLAPADAATRDRIVAILRAGG